MFDIPSIKIGRIFGIPVEINASWLLIFGLVALSLSATYFPSLPEASGAPGWLLAAVGTGTALLFFGSVLAHELSHSLVVRAGEAGSSGSRCSSLAVSPRWTRSPRAPVESS